MSHIDNYPLNINHPHFEIVLSYPDQLMTKEQRLLANLAKLGSSVLYPLNLTPFIRIKEAHSGNVLINEVFTITTNKELKKDQDIDCFIDLVFNHDDKRSLYSFIYRNTETPILFFDTVILDHS